MKLALVGLLVTLQSVAYLLSGNMDNGSLEFQLEAAISKVFSSVSPHLKNIPQEVLLLVCREMVKKNLRKFQLRILEWQN